MEQRDLSDVETFFSHINFETCKESYLRFDFVLVKRRSSLDCVYSSFFESEAGASEAEVEPAG